MLNRKCPECGSSAGMDEGFILDRDFGGSMASRWVQGRPQRSFWSGAKTKGKECRAIIAWRCEQCGFLRLFAGEVIGPNQ